MSHITTISLKILSLAALKAAVKEMGCQFIEGKTNYVWYGQYMRDTKLPKGMTEDQLGKCEHVIKVPGVRYEIGVVKLQEGGYTLAYDFFGANGIGHDGHKLLEKFGDGLKKLTQTYAVCAAELAAKAKGWMTQRQRLPNGSVKLTMTGC